MVGRSRWGRDPPKRAAQPNDVKFYENNNNNNSNNKKAETNTISKAKVKKKKEKRKKKKIKEKNGPLDGSIDGAD